MAAPRHWSHRLLFRLLLLFYAVFCVLSLFCFPYRSDRLYSVVPENSTFVSEHVRLTGRWQGMCTNPVLTGILGGFGVKPEELEEFAGDRGTVLLIERLAGRNLVTAYSPALPGCGRPGWVFTSWGGGSLQWVRWGILSGLLKDFEKKRLTDGRVVWSMRTDPGRPRQRLVLTADEGQIIGCLAEDAEAAVQSLVWRAQRRSEPIPELAERLAAEPGAIEPRDRMWLRDVRLTEDISVPQLACELEFSGATGLEARGVGAFALPGLRPVSEGLDVARLCGVLQDAPDLLLAAPFRLLEPAISERMATVDNTSPVVASLLGAVDPDSSVVLAALGGAHSGRVASFKVPTLVLVLRLKPGTDVPALVGQALDALNAKQRLGLIPRYYDVGSGTIITADTTVDGYYSMIEESERPALFVKDGQVFVFSNCGVLKQLLGVATDLKSYVPVATAPARPDVALQGDAAVLPAWAAGVRATGVVVYAWADLKEASRAARDAIAVYTLATYTGEFKLSRKGRKTLESVRLWVQALGQFDQCELSVGTRQDRTGLLLKLQRK